MNNKFKIVLVAVEVFVLAVLLLIGVGCQQKWFIVTDDGPRFDWYAVQENLAPDLDLPEESTDDPRQETARDPVDEEPEPTATSQPQHSTWQPEAPSEEPEETTSEPEETTTAPAEEEDPGVDEFPLVPLD